MKGKLTEKRIYELLGVNLFRKYILGVYQELWNVVDFITFRKLGLKNIYKMHDFSLEGLKSYLEQSKVLVIEHVCSFALMSFLMSLTLATGSNPSFVTYLISFVMFTDVYAIMTQRYHHLRINPLIEKLEKREEKIKIQKECNNTDDKGKSKDLNLYSNEKENIIVIGQQPLSLEEQKKELEDLRKFVIATNTDNTQEQVIGDEDKGQARVLKPR